MDATLRDVTRALAQWRADGRRAVLATVATTDGSAPRGLGARLAIAGPEEWVGALSGGCTEAAVLAEAERLLAGPDDDAAVLVHYAKETMTDVGPVCGATLGVLVEVVDDALVAALEAIVEQATAGTATTYEATYADAFGGGLARVSATARRGTARSHASGASGATSRSAVSFDGHELRELVPASVHLVLGGAGDIARELVLLAQRLAWRTTVVDARATLLAQLERSCTPTRTVRAWSDSAWDELGVDSSTACIALAHEAHHDEPFLARALASEAAYVGAVGSRRVQQARRAALRERGLDDAQLARLHGPAGLDLGGSSAAEVALAIAAEVVAAGNERSGGPLAASTGPIRA